MKNNLFAKSIFISLGITLLPAFALAQEKATLGILDIKPTPSLAASVKPDKKPSLDRIVESLDSQLIDRINATRKFDIVSRSDVNEITKEQQFGASGNVDPKTAAQIGKDLGAKYILTATVDDFQDYVETATFQSIGESATKRVFRLSVVGKIYDSSTGKLLESANFQTGNDAFKQIQAERNYSVKNGELSDEMMVAVSRNMAERIAIHVTDVIFPIKVLIKNDKEVTINRGEGAGVAVGDTFNVFALGKQLIDPDTGEKLGNQEVNVGKVKITEVDPKFSKAQVLEDTGIDQGAILRKSK
jgi:curli biogenesis system outer membrane secretion channel CsgG